MVFLLVWSTFWRSRKFLTNLPKLSCGFNGEKKGFEAVKNEQKWEKKRHNKRGEKNQGRSETIYILRNLHKSNSFGIPSSCLCTNSPSGASFMLNCFNPLSAFSKWLWGSLRLFSDVWSENAELVKRLNNFWEKKIIQNPAILYAVKVRHHTPW